MAADIEKFRAGLDRETRETVDAIRSVVAACHSGLTESVKWNAPSFALGGDDRITLGLERKGGVRVVVHRGARSREPGGFKFDDRHGLARWPASDRGVIVFQDRADVEQRADALGDLCSRWLRATS
ncbi:MAG: DUF1801 domain-containing protein [Phenylobacterium sp.]|uniref:DUF1801 domain-containing protein n=1 Tax=Phenylobacterium sp. TaxID=1871053 RepID=UPI001A420BDE|nr:DUF1801 domain-containing protein [Phenylobacterium sp.]MBL8771456.1 DUF1801 domain-containing protein [Phenylobacterium sp.]